MGFDQTTRNRLQRFVNEARILLSEEFSRQLQNDYGMDPASGDIGKLDSLTFLDDSQRETARLLRNTLQHYTATNPSGQVKDSLNRIIREQAFTVLNRLCAVRMAEARGIVFESVSKGYQSKGFQLYDRLAGTALGEKGDAYRCYLFSLFDELSLNLSVLFDRFSAMGRLFPREAPLLELLDKLNHEDLKELWTEDETIGWIYQYFNTGEERRQMRAESAAPRNSRELAVRNQFFTPRYVVEFLTDNTLGRTWYEMTQGNTSLKESCQYLVRRPNEVFLKQEETAPEQKETEDDLSQEELLKQAVYIPFRPLKDPREIRMLDPACGSMHFGLYAFDLFEQIYLEAWELEESMGVEAFTRSANLDPLHDCFPDLESYRRHIPRLIIEHNIHGVDIDPRAVQIAGLSLWLRAQRTWKEQNLKASERPKIKRSNIVCAEPMPGEKELLQEFAGSLKPTVLGQLLEIIFDKMELAGEAGSLLKIEKEIEDALAKAQKEFNKELKLRQNGDQMTLIPEWQPDKQQSIFDFTDLPSETEFWETAEQSILEALKNYAESAETGDATRRLFAEDAAKGFAFIDLCRKQYDVVLMNPPFGDAGKHSKSYIEKRFPRTKNDLYAAFVENGLDQLRPKGKLGTITSRTGFFLSSFTKWREEILLKESKLDVMADLGFGVLDAMVETAAYCLEKTI